MSREELIRQIADGLERGGGTAMARETWAKRTLVVLDRLGYEIVPRGLVESAKAWRDSVVVHPASELSMNLRAAINRLDKETTDG